MPAIETVLALGHEMGAARAQLNKWKSRKYVPILHRHSLIMFAAGKGECLKFEELDWRDKRKARPQPKSKKTRRAA
jgi:hypothetical protein